MQHGAAYACSLLWKSQRPQLEQTEQDCHWTGSLYGRRLCSQQMAGDKNYKMPEIPM